MKINAKVIKILYEKFTVDLSCKSSDLNTTGLTKDLYYDTEEAEKVKKARDAKKSKKQKVHRKFVLFIIHNEHVTLRFVQVTKLSVFLCLCVRVYKLGRVLQSHLLA